MNIAVLLTGQLRFNHDFKENLKFFLSDINHNIDFFCTTWYEEDVDFKSLNEHFKFKVIDIETYNSYTSFFIKNYESFNNFCLNYKNDEDSYLNYSYPGWLEKVWQHSPCVFYKLYRGYNIINQYSVKNNKNYDLILRLRFDCFLRDKVTEEELKESVIDNNLHVFYHDYKNYNSKYGINENIKYLDGWVDELVFFSNTYTFFKFSNIYNEYYNITTRENTWIIHLIIKTFLKENNIKTVLPKFKISLQRCGNKIDVFDYLF